MSRSLGLGVLIALAIGCGSGGPDDEAVLASLADRIVVPRYEAVAQEARDLRGSLDALCAQPSDEALGWARQAWRDARAPWMRTAAVWFGPVMERRSVSLIDWPETDSERIEAMLADGPPATDDDVRYGLASTQRGLGAVEYLLFGTGAQEALSASPERCGYVASLGRVIEAEADAVLASWKTGLGGSPPYGEYLAGRAPVSMVEGEGVAEVVRTQVFLMRTLVDMRLAAALGLREDGPDLSAVPGGNGANALSDLRNQLLGMRDVYLGDESADGLSVSDLVAALSSETDERMREGFEASLEAVDAVDAPLRDALAERSGAVMAVYERLAELQRTLNTEVVSLLGVSVGFSDTDGDSLR